MFILGFICGMVAFVIFIKTASDILEKRHGKFHSMYEDEAHKKELEQLELGRVGGIADMRNRLEKNYLIICGKNMDSDIANVIKLSFNEAMFPKNE